MIKKSFAIALLAASVLVIGCSSDDDDAPSDVTDTTATAGATTDGDATAGATDGDATAGATDGDATAGATDGDATAGATDGDATAGATDGATDGDATAGATDGDTTGGDASFDPNSIMGLIAAADDLTILEAAILADTDGGLAQTLNDANNAFTIFAPTDAALEGVALEVVTRDVLLTHIASGSLLAVDITGIVGSSLSMTGGAPRPITSAADGSLQISGVTIIEADLVGDNGVIHRVGAVLP